MHKRDVPESLRATAHAALESILDRYERGDPLWLIERMGWWSHIDGNADITITIKEPLP